MNPNNSKQSICFIQNKISTMEEVLSSWIMDFFDDPIYSNHSRQWNTASLMMLRPETSVVIYLYYYHRWMLNHDSFIHNIDRFVIHSFVKINNLLKTILNGICALFNKTMWRNKPLDESLSNKEMSNEKWYSDKFTCVSLRSIQNNNSGFTNVTQTNIILNQPVFTDVHYRQSYNIQPLLIYRAVKKMLYNQILCHCYQCLFPILLILARKITYDYH